MSDTTNNGSGPFETLLTFVSLISGGIFGYEREGIIGLAIGAFILGLIGNRVGVFADFVVKLLFLIIVLLINASIRQFLFDYIYSLINS